MQFANAEGCLSVVVIQLLISVSEFIIIKLFVFLEGNNVGVFSNSNKVGDVEGLLFQTQQCHAISQFSHAFLISYPTPYSPSTPPKLDHFDY